MATSSARAGNAIIQPAPSIRLFLAFLVLAFLTGRRWNSALTARRS